MNNVNSRFCGAHDSTRESIIPCPWDPRHVVTKTRTERHKSRCPGYKAIQQRLSLPFYNCDINIEKKCQDITPIPLPQIDFNKKKRVVEIINKAYEKIQHQIVQSFPKMDTNIPM